MSLSENISLMVELEFDIKKLEISYYFTVLLGIPINTFLEFIVEYIILFRLISKEFRTGYFFLSFCDCRCAI